MTLPDIIPLPWKIGAALALVGALAAGGAAYHHHVYQSGFDDAVAQRAARDLAAVVGRVHENVVLAAKQDAINVDLTKVKYEELAPVRDRIATERVRVGPALCGGPATPAEAQGTAGGDSADPPRRLVRPDLERDIRALKLDVEEDLATGRACQAFLEKNGLVP